MVIAVAVALAGIVPISRAAEAKYYDIPPGDAAETLHQFVDQSGAQVVFFLNKVRGVTTQPVHGTFSARAALERMLASTPLYAVQDERTHALIVNRIETPAAAHGRIPPVAGAAAAASERAPVAADSSVPHARNEDTIEKLPTFTITSERDVSYVGHQSLSTTRTGVELANLPQSVVVLNRSFFNDLNPTILAKALLYVGGAQTGTISWSVDRYMMRGFVGEGDYVDGFRTQTDKNTDLNLIDHVEVIKGPAAIFIANQNQTVGGVINKISKSPTDYRVEALTVQAGLWDGNRADLDVGGPLTRDGRLTGRLLVSGQDSKGYYDFTYEKRLSVLPMVAYRFGPETEAWVKFESFSSHYSAYNGLPLDGRTNAMLDVPRTRNLDENLPLNWRTDWFTRLWTQFTTRPTDFLAIRVAALDSKDTQRRVESVLSPSGATTPTIGADGIARFLPYPQYVVPPNYVAGTPILRTVTAINADYQPRNELQNDYVFNVTTGPAAHTLLLGVDLIDYPEVTRTYSSGPLSGATTTPIDPFNPVYPGRVSVDFSQPPVDATSRSQKFTKLYVLETVRLLHDRVVLSFGGSSNRYALSSVANEYDQNAAAPLSPMVVPRAVLHRNLTQYGAVVKPWSNVSVFYGYNKNFSSNGVQFGAFVPPQQGEQKELGLKSDWLDGRVTLGVNHFEVVQLNNSVAAFPQTTPPSNILVPGTVSRGFDGDLSAALGRNFDIVASFAWFHAYVPLARPYDIALQPYDGRMHHSLPVNNASEHNLAAWLRYKFSGSRTRGLAIGVGGSFLDRRAITDNSNAILYTYLPARFLADAMISYDTNPFRYQLNVDNVFGTRYIYAARSNQVLLPGSPTNLRFAITYKR